ncbi:MULTISPECIES: tetratricopeptide repeat protein [Thermodesulfovibrio]|uniref:tetratricopeptide repeat protein n=1 Tax=Thermodesulfovibrio TaxID=28261 RepID=UPI00114226E0|nr:MULTISPECIES: tetratricopeptide repeat protein [Thermodesulfovibrio]
MPQIVVLHDPLTPQEHLQLGLNYEKKGLIEEAKKHYEEASKSDARGLLFLGNLYLNQGEYNKAEDYYKKAIKKNDKLADAYNNLAWIYCIKNKNLDEAEDMVKKALEIEKDNSDKVKIYQDTLEKIKKLNIKNRRE